MNVSTFAHNSYCPSELIACAAAKNSLVEPGPVMLRLKLPTPSYQKLGTMLFFVVIYNMLAYLSSGDVNLGASHERVLSESNLG